MGRVELENVAIAPLGLDKPARLVVPDGRKEQVPD